MMGGEAHPKMSSVLGPSAVVLGNVRGTGDLEIRGKVQGSIEVEGRIFVAEGGVVLGGIEATTIKIAGDVRGNLIAEDAIFISASGQVEGDVTAPRVGIDAGARVRGTLRTGNEPPRAEQADREQATKQKTLAGPANQTSDGSEPVGKVATDGAPSERRPDAVVELSKAAGPIASLPGVREPSRAKKRRRQRTDAPAAARERLPHRAEAVEPIPPRGVEVTQPQAAKPQPPKPQPPKPQPPKVQRPRGPQGPPKVPTFEKGAKGRTRS